MKIAIFASAFHPHLGGVEELVRQLAHALQRSGNKVIIVTERWPRDLPATEEYEGLSISRFAFRTLSSGTLANQLRAAVSLQMTGSKIQREIADLLVRENIDLVHVQCVRSNALSALKAAKRLKLPLVVTLQGELTMDAAQIYQRYKPAQDIMLSALKGAQAITGCSGQTVKEAEDFLGQPFKERGHVVYNGFILSDFEAVTPYKHSRPYILGIGRHVHQKGFDVLLRAYAQMVGELGSTTALPDLILAGNAAKPTSVHEELKALSHELGMDDRVHFPGRADRERAMALFKGSEFFVLPSRHEPMGIVNLEAMAAGKAIVASKVGGVPELVQEEQNGLLVAPNNPAALCAALRRLVENPTLIKQLGECGAQRAQQFDWDNIATQYMQVYKEAQMRLGQTK